MPQQKYGNFAVISTDCMLNNSCQKKESYLILLTSICRTIYNYIYNNTNVYNYVYYVHNYVYV